MFRLSLFITGDSTVYLLSPTSYLTALCLSFLIHQIWMIYLPSLPHKVVRKNNIKL